MSVLYQVIIRSFAFCRQVGCPKGFNDRSIIAIVLPDPFIGNTHYQCKCVIFTQNTPVKPKITADLLKHQIESLLQILFPAQDIKTKIK